MPFDAANYDTPVTNPVTELLKRAWALIDKPQKWCRGKPFSDDGRRFCSMGALHEAGDLADASLGARIRSLQLLSWATNTPGLSWANHVICFNDNHSHAEVAAAWQRAIELSRGHG